MILCSSAVCTSVQEELDVFCILRCRPKHQVLHQIWYLPTNLPGMTSQTAVILIKELPLCCHLMREVYYPTCHMLAQATVCLHVPVFFSVLCVSDLSFSWFHSVCLFVLVAGRRETERPQSRLLIFLPLPVPAR